jgi:hypothetical protein
MVARARETILKIRGERYSERITTPISVYSTFILPYILQPMRASMKGRA